VFGENRAMLANGRTLGMLSGMRRLWFIGDAVEARVAS